MAEIVGGTVEKKEEVKAAPEVKEEVVEDVDPEEERARGNGWKPEDEFEGAAGTWRTAREFNDRGELLGKIRNQSKEMGELRGMISQLSEHNKRVYLAGQESTLARLRVDKAAAVEDENLKAVVAIDDAIDAAKERVQLARAQPTVAPAPAGPSNQFQEFMEQNPWWTNDTKMRNWAKGAAIEFVEKFPQGKETDVYDYISKEVKKEYPEKFSGRKGPPSPDGAGRVTTSGRSGQKVSGNAAFEKLLDRLPEDHASTARDLVKRGYITAEKYVEDYEAMER